MDELLRRRSAVFPASGADPNDGYCGNNLLIRLDGIKNTRQGHKSIITNWENLVSPLYDFALINPTVNDNSVYFPASCGAVCNDALTMPNDYTVEIYYLAGNDQTSIRNDSVLLEMMKSNQYGIMVNYRWTNLYCYPSNGRSITMPSQIAGQKYGISLVKSSTNAKVFFNGVLQTQGSAANGSQSIVRTRLNGILTKS